MMSVNFTSTFSILVRTIIFVFIDNIVIENYNSMTTIYVIYYRLCGGADGDATHKNTTRCINCRGMGKFKKECSRECV